MTVDSRLFDADAEDEAVELDEAVVRRLTDRQLLWVDIEGPAEGDLRRVAELLGSSTSRCTLCSTLLVVPG